MVLKYDRRLILDTILYVLRTGCTWRQVHEALRDRVRERDGRDAEHRFSYPVDRRGWRRQVARRCARDGGAETVG